MWRKSTRKAVEDLAAAAGAQPYRPLWKRPWRVVMELFGWQSATPTVYVVGAEEPRDLDDPFTDPQVQSRVGLELAKRARPVHRRES